MSKDSSAGGGSNISISDILRNNPDLFTDIANTPASVQPEAEAVESYPVTPSNFYGSGPEITQPDMDYYNQFPLPGQGAAPVAAPVDAETETRLNLARAEAALPENVAGRAAEVERLAADPVMNFTQDPNLTSEEIDEIFTIRQKIQQNEEMARRGFDVPTGFSRVGPESQEVFPELNLGMRGQDLLSATTTPSRVVPAMPILDAMEEEDQGMMGYSPSFFNNLNIGAM